LDSKSEVDIEILKDAPKLINYLETESKDSFNKVLDGLTNLNIPYQINNKLVRGLDYYNNTTFEFVTDKLGSQSAIIAGGRYDNLMKQMGGPDIPGIGWAAGLERLALLSIFKANRKKTISIIPVGNENNILCIKLAQELRNKYICTDISYSGNLK
jgi:histidyl-tRNA synthetase